MHSSSFPKRYPSCIFTYEDVPGGLGRMQHTCGRQALSSESLPLLLSCLFACFQVSLIQVGFPCGSVNTDK